MRMIVYSTFLSFLNTLLQPDLALPVQPLDMLNGSSHKASLSLMHNALHEEIDQFCKQVSPFSPVFGITIHLCVCAMGSLTSLMPNCMLCL